MTQMTQKIQKLAGLLVNFRIAIVSSSACAAN
jgi:hypothetical protein